MIKTKQLVKWIIEDCIQWVHFPEQHQLLLLLWDLFSALTLLVGQQYLLWFHADFFLL